MRSFGKTCLQEMPKQGNSVAAYGMSRAIAGACKTPASRKLLYQSLGCFNPVSKSMRKELSAFREDMIRASFFEDNKPKILAACCSYFNHSTALVKAGSGICDHKKRKYLEKFVNGFASEVLDLICPNTSPGSEKCASLVLPPVALADKVPYVQSFIPALLSLMDSM